MLWFFLVSGYWLWLFGVSGVGVDVGEEGDMMGVSLMEGTEA